MPAAAPPLSAMARRSVLMATDAVMPAIELTMLEELRTGSVVALDVVPALDAELVLGIVQRAARTLVPGATRAFGFVRQYFTALGGEPVRGNGAPG